MLRTYQIEYNGFTPENFGAFLPDYPQISSAKRQYETITVPNMDGNLITTDDYYDNITINCTIALVHKKLLYKLDDMRRWLRGTGRLKLSDLQDRYYEVLAVDTEDMERHLRRYGTFNAVFTCYPYAFLNSGAKAADYRELRRNPYDMCKPTYIIRGNGDCTITVNGRRFKATVGQEITIDSRRMLAYKSRGTGLLNTSVAGDYEDLWIDNGDVAITVTQGFDLKIITNWGYKA